jgi:ribose-phosphate pyrophosphokinase
MKPLIYALPGNEAFADRLGAAWPAEAGGLIVHQFPDGESLVRLRAPARGRDVVLACTLHEPDTKILPLLFAAETARAQGARSVGLVAPYLAYMRQDRVFRSGEASSAQHFAQLLSSHLDWLVTVDPHLHRIHALSEIYPIPTAVVPAAPLLARWIAANVQEPVLIGPDEESAQWVRAVAEAAHAPWQVLRKVRTGDRTVDIGVPDHPRWTHRTPVLVDDIISSGGTLIHLVRKLRAQELPPPVCVAVHAVFAPLAYRGLVEAGAGRIVTTNTIAHDTNAIDVAAAVADEARQLRLRHAPERGAA